MRARMMDALTGERSTVKSIALESNLNDMWSLERVNLYAGERKLTKNKKNRQKQTIHIH